jgi:DNA-binding NarL/FixJ family response regulator
MPDTPVRVLVADDEPLVRSGLRLILDAEPDIEVVGEAGDGAQAVELARALRPDVVCMDVRMPGVDGLRATELVLRLPEPPRVLVVTTFEHDGYVLDALTVGASGFLLKRAGADELVQAVRTVAVGQSLLYPQALRDLIRTRPRTAAGAPVLTPREREVLGRMAEGRSNAGIARALWVAEGTVEKHVRSIMAKLDLPETTDDHRRVLAVITFLEAH